MVASVQGDEMFIRRFTSLSALVVVTQVRLGNAGRNSLRGPRLLNLDFGLFRDFAIVERVHPQFRAEAFNFTNTPHRGLPAATLPAAAWTSPHSDSDCASRSDQITLRVSEGRFSATPASVV